MSDRTQFVWPLAALLLAVFVLKAGASGSAPQLPAPGNTVSLPRLGEHELQFLTPNVLELTWISSPPEVSELPPPWDFGSPNPVTDPPATNEFVVITTEGNAPVLQVSCKRRVAYAPLKPRDLRVESHLYLTLARPLPASTQVTVSNPNAHIWSASLQFTNTLQPRRWTPVLHVNQTGYMPDQSKIAMVGFYLGNLGELSLNQIFAGGTNAHFRIIEDATGRTVFQGRLTPRPDHGFPYACYQEVWQADFSAFRTPGCYRLEVDQLGTSYPFRIDENVAGAFARAYALGLYHQRCGTNNAMPFTRFTHDPCHTANASVPVPESAFKFTWETIAAKTADWHPDSEHAAPRLAGESSQLYPFVRHGQVDVSGGHHDAGDYSKYTINSAALIHCLMFAVDAFPGVASLDNLGLPESGDGHSDVLQEAKWEADFLAKMQDDDGGFYFLVYPREREYENDVTPDHGDPQVVWPKNTSATAAAVAALAQCASSPEFKGEFPDAAAKYLQQAQKGWDFLARALARYGEHGAYQKITHYGNEFADHDELAWAACEMFLATGEPRYQQKLLEWLGPDVETRRWGWWRLYEAYGCALRDYAFAARTGRLKTDQLDRSLLARCEQELIEAANDQLRRANDSAYGVSLPEETKRSLSAGWFFAGDASFDLAVACQLDFPPLNDPRPSYLAAILGNLNYEAGCNPVNVCFLTGLGWHRQREIVDQYAENDRRLMPPSGLPIGQLQDGFGWLDLYGATLGKLSYPLDGDPAAPYPLYDRWGDSFNLKTEFVIVNQGKSLAYLSWLMAHTTLAHQPWTPVPGQILLTKDSAENGNGLQASLSVKGLDLSPAKIIWEAAGQEPALSHTYHVAASSAPLWVEAEAQLPDGRRIFAVTNLSSTSLRNQASAKTLSLFSTLGSPVRK